jgi:tetratricopeptide (TPR) repeat protein
VLNKLQDAVKYSLDFVKSAPKDPRSKELLSVAMAQIGELKKVAAQTKTPLSDDTNNLIAEALALSTGEFKDKRFRYAQGRNLEDSGKLVEAAKVYAQIETDDNNYIDARFRLVGIATTRLGQLTGAKASNAEVSEAANDLFKACSQFLALLDNPPKNMPREVLDRAPTYRTGILMVEASTALNPSVKRPEIAIDRLDKLDKIKDQLTDLQKGAVLRYRIQAYQMNGQVDKIMPLLTTYASTTGQNPIAVFQGLAVSTVQEIEQVKNTDPEQAKRLADFVVKLFDPIIEQAVNDTKAATDPKVKEQHKKTAFDLKQIKAEMMVRAGDYKGAAELCKQLIEEDPGDIRSYMNEARATFLKAQADKSNQDYKVAQDYFTRIVHKVTPGVDAYWECWLRIIECTETLGGQAASDEIKKRLSDLAASSSKFGGEVHRTRFMELASKYGVTVK